MRSSDQGTPSWCGSSTDWGVRLRILLKLSISSTIEGSIFSHSTPNIDTATPGGKLIFHLMEALAEFERDLIRERTNAGLAAARARGRVGGRPRRVSDGKVALAQHLYQDPNHSVAEICSMLGISRSTFFRYINVRNTINSPPPTHKCARGLSLNG